MLKYSIPVFPHLNLSIPGRRNKIIASKALRRKSFLVIVSKVNPCIHPKSDAEESRIRCTTCQIFMTTGRFFILWSFLICCGLFLCHDGTLFLSQRSFILALGANRLDPGSFWNLPQGYTSRPQGHLSGPTGLRGLLQCPTGIVTGSSGLYLSPSWARFVSCGRPHICL